MIRTLGLMMMMAALSAAAPASAAGALAVGHCGVDGYSYDNASPEQAEERALQECGPSCRIVAAFEGSCAAFAVDYSRSCGAEGWGRAESRREAESIAISECANQGGAACRVKRWVCDGG